HVVVVHFPPVHSVAGAAQSAPVAHPFPGPHLVAQLPPQSTSVSSPSTLSFAQLTHAPMKQLSPVPQPNTVEPCVKQVTQLPLASQTPGFPLHALPPATVIAWHAPALHVHVWQAVGDPQSLAVEQAPPLELELEVAPPVPEL